MALFSTYTQRILSACGAPAAVWDGLLQGPTNPFHYFIDSRDENTVFRKYSTLFHIVNC